MTKEEKREWYFRNRERIRAGRKIYNKENEDKIKAKAAVYREKNRGRLNERQWEFNARNRERVRQAARAYARGVRENVICKLGGVCVCCGETEHAFLSIDHVMNDGAAHRRELASGKRKYADSGAVRRAIIKEGYPLSKYQVLCYNCNCAKQFNPGGCPHNKIPSLNQRLKEISK